MAQGTTANPVCGSKRTMWIPQGRIEIDLTCQIDMLERPQHTGNDGDPHRMPDLQDGVYIVYRWVNK